MTEIIDDVDVSGCAFYSKGKCNNPNGMACNCCNNVICYYKELKRLEFENKLLKADYEASEEENKKLKEALENIRKITIYDNEVLKDEQNSR